MRNPQIETAEISDADLENVSGGVGVDLPGGLGGVDVSGVPNGVSVSAGAGVPGLGGVSAGAEAGLNGVAGGVTSNLG